MTVFYRTLCNNGISRTQGIFRTLSNIYDGKSYSQTCLTLIYLETWHIQNVAKHLPRNILFKALCKPRHIQHPSITRTLVYPEIKVYSEPYRISKTEHFFENPL